MEHALHLALSDARLLSQDVDGLIAVPSLAQPHFMEAHFLCTRMKLLPNKNFIARTIDTGGAGPITALLEAKRMILMEGCEVQDSQRLLP